jgi:hypothetical protein
MVGALVSVNDFAIRPAKGMNDGEVFNTGQHRFRFVQHHITALLGSWNAL